MMDNPKDKISTAQAAVTVASTVIGAGIITMPRTMARVVETPDIWISVLLGGLISIAAGIILVKLSQRFAEITFFQYSKVIVGKFMGSVLGLLLVVFCILVAAFQARMLSELVRAFLLQNTPVEVVIIIFICVATYLTAGGINPIARAFELYFPIISIIFFSIMLLSFQHFRLDNLRPVMGNGFAPVLKGIAQTFLVYTGYGIMMILTSFMKEPKKAVKAVTVGVTIPIIFYVTISIMVTGVLTVDEIKTVTWPTASIVNLIQYPGGFIENFQVFFLIVWILAIYSTFVAFQYTASLGSGQIFGKDFGGFMYALLPIIYIAAILPEDLEAVFKFGDFLGYYGISISLVMSPLLLIISIIKRKGCKKKQNER